MLTFDPALLLRRLDRPEALWEPLATSEAAMLEPGLDERLEAATSSSDESPPAGVVGLLLAAGLLLAGEAPRPP